MNATNTYEFISVHQTECGTQKGIAMLWHESGEAARQMVACLDMQAMNGLLALVDVKTWAYYVPSAQVLVGEDGATPTLAVKRALQLAVPLKGLEFNGVIDRGGRLHFFRQLSNEVSEAA